MPIDSVFWDRTNTLGRFVRTLSAYKAFTDVWYTVGAFGNFLLHAKCNSELKDAGLQSLSVLRDTDGVFLVQFWGAVSHHRYTEKAFKSEAETHDFIRWKISTAANMDKQKEKHDR